MSKANRAHPTREVVLEERREALTKDEKGRGVLRLRGGRSGRRRRGFDKLRALAGGLQAVPEIVLAQSFVSGGPRPVSLATGRSWVGPRGARCVQWSALRVGRVQGRARGI